VGRWAGKYVIGLTGNIGMGKSVVRKMLEHLGAYTIDADGLTHQTMVPGAPAYHPVVEQFGKWILDKDGKINRSKLGAVAFSHPEALTLLESITHPVIGRGIDTLISRAKQPIIVLEAIKLIEGSLAAGVDTIWVVDSAPQVQLQRLIEKRAMPEGEARKRIEGQNPQREKLARANAVITNNTTLQDVWVQVEREWGVLMKRLGLHVEEEEVLTSAAPQTPPSVTVTPMSNINLAQSSAQAAAQPPSPTAQPVVAPKPPTQPIPTPTQPTPPPSRPVLPAMQPPTPQPAQPSAAGMTGTAETARSTQAAPSVPPQPPASKPVPVPPPAGAAQPGLIKTQRVMPKTSEALAGFINRLTGKALNRMDIMAAFGQKSYWIATASGQIIGATGFQVENLITRVDEFLIIPGAPLGVVAKELILAVEEASRQLQSEVGFFYMPTNTPPLLVQAFREQGYHPTPLDAITIPAWREAAQESQPSGTAILMKQYRERILKPI